jgi:hypothetical protein
MPLQLLLMFYEKERTILNNANDTPFAPFVIWAWFAFKRGNESVNTACTKLKSKSPTLYQCGGHACLWLHLLFGCGLLSKEDAKSYVWLFKIIFLCFFFLMIIYICFFYNFPFLSCLREGERERLVVGLEKITRKN